MADPEDIELHPQVSIEDVANRRVTINCHYEDCCRDIVKNLNKCELEKMDELTPFGTLIRYGSKFTKYNKLIWYLIASQVPSCSINIDELLMVINKRPIRYSIAEFTLITGLKCTGDEEFPRSVGEFGETYFSDRAFSFNGTKKLFEEMESAQEGDHNLDKIRMAGLYFVVAAILPHYSKTVELDSKWLSLFSDLDRCCEFPWGKLVFAPSLTSVKTKMVEKLAQKTINVTGLLFPIQILAFECIDGLAAKLNVECSDDEDLTPRCLKWSVPAKYSTFEELLSVIPSCKDVRFRLTPSRTEQGSAYFIPYEATDGTTSSRIDGIFMSGRSVRCLDAPKAVNSDSPRPAKKSKTRTRSIKSAKKSKTQKMDPLEEMRNDVNWLKTRVDKITKILINGRRIRRQKLKWRTPSKTPGQRLDPTPSVPFVDINPMPSPVEEENAQASILMEGFQPSNSTLSPTVEAIPQQSSPIEGVQPSNRKRRPTVDAIPPPSTRQKNRSQTRIRRASKYNRSPFYELRSKKRR